MTRVYRLLLGDEAPTAWTFSYAGQGLRRNPSF